jgi:nanoRNase/pAp phosphatase (c-di-AMP/oligoRNAs hydrolase)
VLGSILDALKINTHYNIAFSCLTLKEMKNFSESEETFDSVMNFLSNIEGVKAVMLLREEIPGIIKGSLRSDYPNMDISKLAKHLCGGGHPKASGFKTKGQIVKTKNSWKII